MSRYLAARVMFALVCACLVPAAAAIPWAHDWKVTDRLALGDTPVVAADAAGGVLVGSSNAHFVRYDAAGNRLWTGIGSGPLYGSAGYAEAYGAIADPDGSAWYTVTSDSYEAVDTVLTRVDASGAVVWTRPVSGGSLVRVADGVVVAGCGWTYKGVATKFDMAGNLVWQRALPATGCRATAIATSDGSDVYVAQGGDGLRAVVALSRIAADGRVLATVERPASPLVFKVWVLATPEAVYVGADDQTFAVGATNLSPRWEATDCRLRDVVPATAAVGAHDAWCVGWQGHQRRTPGGAVRLLVPIAPGYDGLDTIVRALPDGAILLGDRSVRRIDALQGNVVWERPLFADNVPGDASVGVGVAQSGRVTVVASQCDAAATHCTARMHRVALADGVVEASADVDDAPTAVVGYVKRNGADIGFVVRGRGATDTLRVRVLSASDGIVRWEARSDADAGRHIHFADVAFGDDFVAAAAAWSMSSSPYESAVAGVDVAVFDRATGALRWRSSLLESDPRTADSLSIVADANVLVLGTYGAIRRYAVTNGNVLWREPAKLTDPLDLYLAGGDVVANLRGSPSNGSRVTRIALSNGHRVWQSAAPLASSTRPLVVLPDGDILAVGFASGNSMAPVASRVDFATGAVEWQTPYGDGVRRHTNPYAVLRSNGELWIAGASYAAPDNYRKPSLVRIAAATGARLSTPSSSLPADVYGLYTSLTTSGDGRVWANESRRLGIDAGAAANWLVEFDAAGAVTGRQALRINPFSDIVRMPAVNQLDAPAGGMVLLGGTVLGGGSGDGPSAINVPTGLAAIGDLSVTLDPLPVLRPGRSTNYAATVRYDGNAPMMGTLYLQLPWPDAGAAPTCSGPPADCSIDERNGWLLVRFRVVPGGSVRVSGALTARALDGAFDARSGQPVLQAAVIGDTTLRETDVDDNFVRLYGVMSLFADGFQ